MVRLPPGLRIESFNPVGMYMHFEPEALVSLGVNLTIEGEPPEGYRFKQATPTPRFVRLRGAQNVLESMHNVLSRPLSLVNVRDTVTVPVELAPLPKHVRLADEPPPKFTATIVVELVERHYASVPITPNGQPQNVRLNPTTAMVILRGRGARSLPRRAAAYAGYIARRAQAGGIGVPQAAPDRQFAAGIA